MINSLHVENFTVFKKADFEFVPGINVLVGANGTGKTHVLKLLYAMQKAQVEFAQRANFADMRGRLLNIFRPEKIDDLIRQSAADHQAVARAVWNSIQTATVRITPGAVGFPEGTGSGAYPWSNVSRPVYIPPKDMLANAIGFLSLYDRREIDFDETYYDILISAYTPLLRREKLGDMNGILDLLEERIGGHLEAKGERFYLEGPGGNFEIHMVAEGWRKIALLNRLIANGSIDGNSILYWDEPESNENPSLMDEQIHVLLQLARMGTQIFIATHEYIVLKELELQSSDKDAFRMFALERSKKDSSVSVHPASTYSDLSPNLIADQFDRIYDMEVARTLGPR